MGVWVLGNKYLTVAHAHTNWSNKGTENGADNSNSI